MGRAPDFRLVIPREEYDCFLVLLRDDEEFPTTYDGWRKSRFQKVVKDAKGRPRDMAVHCEEFKAWCAASGLNPSLAALEAFAVAKARREA